MSKTYYKTYCTTRLSSGAGSCFFSAFFSSLFLFLIRVLRTIYVYIVLFCVFDISHCRFADFFFQNCSKHFFCSPDSLCIFFFQFNSIFLFSVFPSDCVHNCSLFIQSIQWENAIVTMSKLADLLVLFSQCI